MVQTADLRFDAYLVYAPADRPAAEHLAAQLRNHGLTIHEGEKDIPWGEAIQRGRVEGLSGSRFVVVLLSPASLEGGWHELEVLVASHGDPSSRERRVVWLRVKDCVVPAHVQPFRFLDVLTPAQWEEHLPQIVKTLSGEDGPSKVQPQPLRPGPQHLPPDPKPIWVGRGSELEELARWLLPKAGEDARVVAICALQGMAGIGKTYLAEQFSARHGGAFPGGIVRLVLDPEQKVGVEQLLGRIADAVDARPPVARLAQHLDERFALSKALIHIDNVDSDPLADAVGALARALPRVRMIVTGRHQGLGKSPTSRWKRLELATLSPEEALALLRQELEARSAALPSSADAQKLVKELGHLPLAIHLAAGYLAEGHTVSTFLTALERARLDLPQNAPDDHTLVDPRRATLHATFQLSFGLLTSSAGGERAAQTLAALAQAPSVGFGLLLAGAVAGRDEVDLRQDVSRLVRLSLLTAAGPLPDNPRYRLHPLLRSWLRSRHPALGAAVAMARWFLEMLPKGEDQALRWAQLHEEHEGLAEYLGGTSGDLLAGLIINGYSYARSHGPMGAWVSAARGALKDRHPAEQQLRLTWRLGNLAFWSGDTEIALETAELHANLARQEGQKREVALALGLQADILEARGELDEALRIRREEQLPVYERLGDVRERAITLGKVADILQARGELDEALRIRREEELPVFERLGDVRERAITLGKVTDILRAKGATEEALRILREQVLPTLASQGDEREQALIRAKVANILHDRGELNEALRIRCEEVLPVHERQRDVLSLLVGRTNTAMLLMEISPIEHHAEAAQLLTLALNEAVRLRIPEAKQIRALQRHFGFTPT